MGTALDEYKRYYGLQHDGETVLEHAYRAHFRDSVTNNILTADKLEDLGITAEMSREQVVDCLSGQPGAIDRRDENVVQLYRYSIQQVIDFCSEQFAYIEENKPVQQQISQKIPLMDKISIKIIDPIFDAIGRRLYTGSFRKRKPKE
jgi:hypothetical protein